MIHNPLRGHTHHSALPGLHRVRLLISFYISLFLLFFSAIGSLTLYQYIYEIKKDANNAFFNYSVQLWADVMFKVMYLMLDCISTSLSEQEFCI